MQQSINPFIDTVPASTPNYTITKEQSFYLLSVKNPASSSGVVTITGMGTANRGGIAYTGNGITLQAGEDWTWKAEGVFPLDGINIATAIGATAQITAS